MNSPKRQPAIAIDQQIDFVLAIFTLCGLMIGLSFSNWFMLLDIISGVMLLISALAGRQTLVTWFEYLPWNR